MALQQLEKEVRDWELFMETAKEVVDDFKLLVSGVSEERVPDVITLIQRVADACKCIFIMFFMINVVFSTSK